MNVEGALFFAFCPDCRIELIWQDPIERMLWVAGHTSDHPEHKPGSGRAETFRHLTNN